MVQGKISGSDKEPEGDGPDDETDQEIVGGSENENEQPRTGQKKLETMAEMVDRITRFASVRLPFCIVNALTVS